ncbi:MAG: hypothetical protein Q9210_003962 [Variospora velana]
MSRTRLKQNELIDSAKVKSHPPKSFTNGPSPESRATKGRRPRKKPTTKPTPKRRQVSAGSRSDSRVEDPEAVDNLFITSDVGEQPSGRFVSGRDGINSTGPPVHAGNRSEKEVNQSIDQGLATTDWSAEKAKSEPNCSRASEGETDKQSRGAAEPRATDAQNIRPGVSEDEDGDTIAAEIEPDEPAATRLRLRPLRKPRSPVPDLALDGKIIVAVDFGTTFSALCWAHTRYPDDQSIIEQWPDNECLEAFSNAKVPTELQYTEDGCNWGFQIPHDVQRHQWFKLGLDPKRPRPISGLASALADEKAAPPGYNQSAETLVVDYLSKLRSHFVSVLKQKLPASVLDTTPMQYIITHPAIWSATAVAATKRCAEKAGMNKGENLQLVTEPEAAAIWALPRLVPYKPQVGDSFILCDAGGGTVDLISYQIKALKPIVRVTEVARGDGGLCGSTFLNRRFTAFLRGKLGGHDAWREEMLEEVKRRFKGSKESTYQIPVPAFPDEESLGVHNARFTLKGEEVYGIFEPVIQEVISLVTRQIHSAEAVDAAARGIILVGGFGENNYLYERLCEAAGKVEVLRPPKGWTAVVHGALMKGLAEASNTTSVATVSGRKARNYFGTASAKAYDETIHPVGKRSKANKRWEVNTYDWFIIKGATVKEDKPMHLPYHIEVPVSAVQNGALEPITTTIFKYDDPGDTGPPLFVAYDDGEVEEIATLHIPLDLISIKRLKIRKRDDGSEWYIVDFSLRVTCYSSETIYELRHKRSDFGRVSTEYV